MVDGVMVGRRLKQYAHIPQLFGHEVSHPRIHSILEFAARHLNPATCHPALMLDGACKHSAYYDTMHDNDLNGVSAHCLGNLFTGAIKNKELNNANIDEGVETLNTMIKTWYSDYGVQNRMPALRWNNLIDGEDSYPCLKGNA